MSYKVSLTAAAVKEFKRIDQTLRRLQSEPRPSGVKKLSGQYQDWRVRVGDYRILYEIDDDQQRITVWRIAHRRDVYR